MNFAQRSARTELIDEPGIPFSDWEICLHELNLVNTYLGGHKITIEGIKVLLKNNAEIKDKITICEIGCGGGDNLKAIHKWINGSIPVKYIGVDINKACIDFATNNCKELDAIFVCSDYRNIQFAERPDIIFNSLFCHHFTNEKVVEMLGWMKTNALKGFFINDLHRHPFAYYSIKMLTNIFSRSYLVKNDGPISVLRGFHGDEWKILLNKAGIANYSIHWRWAFRNLIICKQ